MNAIRQLLDVPSTDPEDARRRKLLNILLVGILLLTLVEFLVTVIVGLGGTAAETALINLITLAVLTGTVLILIINRYVSGWLASSLFLVLLTAVFALSNSPEQVANGRTLVVFAIPITIASVVLTPYAGFIMAGLSSLVVSLLALSVHIEPNIPAILGFFTLALVSWLSARSLQNALKDLRTLNRELDQRVADRTQELYQAVTRERAEANKNEAILQGIADGVVVFDNRGIAIVANPAIGHLLQRPIDKITDCDIETLMGTDVTEADREAVVNLLRSTGLSAPSVKFRWGEKTLSVSFAPVRDLSGEVIGTVAVFRDITREAEVDRMKSTFVSIASHELRTPLNAILGYAEMLQKEVYGALLDKQRAAIERILTNTGQLLSLADNVLDQAQIEAGKLTLNVAAFAPMELLDGVEGVMGVLAQNKGLKLVTSIAADMPAKMFGDPQRLRQILVNLTNNAIKFTSQGTVNVRIYRPRPECWALEVSDTGCGIPAEAQPHIFDAFRRVDSSVTREQVGVGLGLSIVKQLTTLMAGEIALESQVGHGSIFTVVLPLVLTQEALS